MTGLDTPHSVRDVHMKHGPEESGASVVGRGVADGYLPDEEIARIAREGLARLPVDGRRVLVLIPDGTRTMPMPAMFETIERELGPRVAALDFLVALGTHTPMSDAQLSQALRAAPSSTAWRAAAGSSITAGTTPPRSRRSGRDPGARDSRADARPAERDRAGGAEPAAGRLRPRRHLRAGVPA